MANVGYDSQHVPHDGPLRVDVRYGPDSTCLSAQGGMDMLTVPTFAAAASALFQSNHSKLVLDLRGVGFFGSSGLTALLDIADTADRSGTKLMLVASRPVQKMLQMLGFADRFRILPSPRHAGKAVR